MNFLTSRIGRSIAQKIDTTSVTEADALFANSKWTARGVEEFYDKKPTVCYPGVDSQFLAETGRVKKVGRNEWGRYVFSSNRHYPQKKLEWLIQIFHLLHSDFKQARLLLTGSATKYTEQLVKLRDELGLQQSVIFTGEVKERELVRLYLGAEVCAYPAPEEDLGLGPLEAGACGIPSVVWNHAGPAETVLEGVTGFRAKPYDKRDFATKLGKIMSDQKLRKRLGANAFDYVLKGFTWKHHIDVLEKRLGEIT
jgi:glycosyltransferase involved in cell wall biosynthesis